MGSEDLMGRVRALRARGYAPKQIARALGVPPATVAPLVRAIAAADQAGAAERKLVGCWVSPGWSEGLTVQGHPEWPDVDAADAVAYARSLGFEPAPGFEATAGQLGPWAGPSAIGFGRHGKPFFVQGPHDNAAAILTTLERSVGRDNFHFVARA